MTPAEELADLLTSLEGCGATRGEWVNGFVVRTPKDLGRSWEGRTLRRLYSLSLRVRGRRPFDLALLSAHAGQSVEDWLLSGIAAFERWLVGEGDHRMGQAEDAGAEDVVHVAEASLDAMQLDTFSDLSTSTSHSQWTDVPREGES